MVRAMLSPELLVTRPDLRNQSTMGARNAGELNSTTCRQAPPRKPHHRTSCGDELHATTTAAAVADTIPGPLPRHPHSHTPHLAGNHPRASVAHQRTRQPLDPPGSSTTAPHARHDARSRGRRPPRAPRPDPRLRAPARPAIARGRGHVALCTSASHGRHPTSPLTPAPAAAHSHWRHPGPRDPVEPRRQTAPPPPTPPGLCPATPFGGGEGRGGGGEPLGGRSLGAPVRPVEPRGRELCAAI